MIIIIFFRFKMEGILRNEKKNVSSETKYENV